MRRPKRDKRSELAVKTVATIRSQGKTGIQNVAAVSSRNVWAVGGQRLCRENFALSTAMASTMPPSKAQL